MDKVAAPHFSDTQPPALQSDKWQRISPASIIYFVLKFISGLVRNGLQSVAPVAAVLATTGENRWFALGLLAAGAGLVLAVGAVLSYLNFKFRIDGDAFLIRSGVLTRKRLTLTFDRIQNVAFREPIYFRPFNLVILTLESAGSTSEEVSLAGIPRPLAETIRRFVLRYKQLSPAKIQAERPVEADTSPTRSSENETTDLLRQPVSELVRYGISNNNVWVFAGLTAGALAQFDDLWDSGMMQGLFDLVGETVGTGLVAISAFAVFVAFIILILLMAASVLGAIIVNFNYHLTYADGRYHRTRGLFERQETSVPGVKIQSLKIAQPVIARLLDRFHLTLNQVGFEGNQAPNKKQKFIIPSVQQDFYTHLSGHMFQGSSVLNMPLKPISGKFVARQAIYTFGGPSIIVSILWAINVGWLGLVPLLLPLVMLPLIILRKNRYGYATDGAHAVVRQGLFGQNLTVFPLFKVQTIRISQSPGQKRAGLCNLKIKLAGHSVTVPYLPLEDARAWRAAALRQMETSTRPWM